MMKRVLIACCLTMALTFPLSAAADEEAPWYEFEVLIFQRIAPGAGSTEFWPEDPGTPDFESAIPFNTQGSATLIDNRPVPYRPLPASERRLGGVWSTMRNSRNYRPLYHVAWRQQVVDPEAAQGIALSVPAEDELEPPVLEGVLRVGVKRYLHFEADLLLTKPQAAEQQSEAAYMAEPRYTRYRLHTQRRMRSGKLHYLDHPILGVLVQAERFELPEPEPEPEPETPSTDMPLPAETPAGESPAPATGEAAQPQG